jgi:hypothetical protein
MDKKPAPIIPSIAPETSDPFLDRLLTPARFFKRPDDVLADRTLDVREKRAILSPWASDACAVESMPALRQTLHSVRVSHHRLIRPSEWKAVDGMIALH